MDYSTFYLSITIEYLIGFTSYIITIILLVCGDIFLIKRYLKSKSEIELVGIIVCIVAIIIVAYFSRNFFKDIPNVIGKNYTVSTGTAYGWNTAGQEPEARGFEFQKDDGEIIKLQVIYTPIRQGDRFEVIYLPNTGFGAIVQKIDKGKSS